MDHLSWTKADPDIQLYTNFPPRCGHSIFVDEQQDILILHGGYTATNATGPNSTETWLYDFKRNVWTSLPAAPAPALSAAYVTETLYTISGSSRLGGSVHYMNLRHDDTERERPDALVWQTVDFLPTL